MTGRDALGASLVTIDVPCSDRARNVSMGPLKEGFAMTMLMESLIQLSENKSSLSQGLKQSLERVFEVS
jgi:hypothetical protein